jgi:hypothetical protein
MSAAAMQGAAHTRKTQARPRTAHGICKAQVRRKEATMFCNGCNNNNQLWLIILIIILFSGCNNGYGSGCCNNCGCNNNCGCSNNCCNDCGCSNGCC